jgi:hypothetical protein
MLKGFLFLLKKGGVTAAGPLPAFTGFPIKPLKAPQPFYAKVSGGVKEKILERKLRYKPEGCPSRYHKTLTKACPKAYLHEWKNLLPLQISLVKTDGLLYML